MIGITFRFPRALIFSIVFVSAVAGSVAQDSPRVYVDEDYAFKITAPKGWQRINTHDANVPGIGCRAWSAGTRTIAVSVFKDSGPQNPRGLLERGTKHYKEQLGCSIGKQEIRDISGMKALCFVATGKGTGTRIDGKGETSLTMAFFIVPREKDRINIFLTTREEDFSTDEKVLEAMLKTMEVSGKQTDEQKAAK